MSEILNLDNVELDDLTIDEIDAVEQITGKPLQEFAAEGTPQAVLLRALAVIVKNRENPAEFPIGSAAEIAESKRKVGAFRVAAPKQDEAPADAEGNADPAVEAAPSDPATPSDEAVSNGS